MKFQSGSRVEVLSDKDSLGAWRCAEIVEDTGDGYRIRYHRGAGIAKGSVKKVSAKAIRPCPRRVAALKNLGVGDVVEVLDDGSWRVSVIQEDMGDDDYFISVIGSLDEFIVKNSSIRERQEWKEDKWIPNEKSFWDLASGIRKKSYVQPKGNSLKRSSPDHGVTCEALLKNVKKQKVVDKDVVLEAIHDSYSFVGEVDNSGSRKGIQCKDDVQPTTKVSIKYNPVNDGSHNGFQLLVRTFDDDCASTVSSVASCSIANAISDRLVSNSSASCSKDSESLSSDAESHGYLGVENDVSDSQLKCIDALRAHELDLHYYRSILHSLYVSGPLSWPQEVALTNLRMRLCVSNDEHLVELRRLRSIGDLGLKCH